MIVKDLQPFSIVEDEGFKSLINYLEPSYKLPSRYTLSTTFLNAQYTLVETKLKKPIERRVSYFLNHRWLDFTGNDFLSSHYCTLYNKLGTKVSFIGCFECHERHTAEYIKMEIYHILSKWEIEEKIFTCVADNATNMKAAVRFELKV